MVIAFFLFLLFFLFLAADGQGIAIYGDIDVVGLAARNLSPYNDGIILVSYINCGPGGGLNLPDEWWTSMGLPRRPMAGSR